jgi:small-conductance mechanosensitive channel
MFLAQVAPATAPATISSANKFYIIGDLDAVKPDIPPSWTDLILHKLGYIALAFVIGWVAKKALGWAATKFEQSPIAEAAIAASGKALPTLLPAYALLFIIKENAPYLAHGEWLHFAAVSAIFLTSLAHTTAIFYLVEIPIAWARKVADETNNKLDDVLVPMISTVIKISVILVGGFKAISIIDPKSSEAILGLLAGAVVGLAFASQDTIKNVFGAVMLIVDQPFTLGDFINTGTHEGKVEALGLRSTTIELLDGQKLAIPNGDLANRAIVNITRRDFIRAQDLVHLEVNTPSEKIQQAVTIIRESLVDHEGFDSRHPPLVHVTEFSDWAVNIRLMYWFRPANAAKQLEFNQKLLLRISEKLQAADIRLAAQGTPQTR